MYLQPRCFYMKLNTIQLPESFLDESIQDGYTVSTEAKKLWAAELDILAKLDEVCENNGLKYFFFGGTLLGAVRHKGFIPWDDDIDVGMLREDYNKLMSIPDAFPYPYFLQNFDTDDGYYRMHAKIRNSETTAIVSDVPEEKDCCNQGVFVDIFPFDYIEENPIKRKVQLLPVRMLKRIIKIILQGKRTEVHSIKDFGKSIIFALYRKADIRRLLSKADKYSGKKKEGRYVTWVTTNALTPDIILENKMIPIEAIGETKKMPFNGFCFSGPNDPDYILRKHYGEDYMTPKIGTQFHTISLIDTEKAYTDYIERTASE